MHRTASRAARPSVDSDSSVATHPRARSYLATSDSPARSSGRVEFYAHVRRRQETLFRGDAIRFRVHPRQARGGGTDPDVVVVPVNQSFAGDGEQHDQQDVGKAVEDVDDPHHQRVDRPSDVSGERAVQSPDDHGQCCSSKADTDGYRSAGECAYKHITPLIVGAEQVEAACCIDLEFCRCRDFDIAWQLIDDQSKLADTFGGQGSLRWVLLDICVDPRLVVCVKKGLPDLGGGAVRRRRLDLLLVLREMLPPCWREKRRVEIT